MGFWGSADNTYREQQAQLNKSSDRYQRKADAAAARGDDSKAAKFRREADSDERQIRINQDAFRNGEWT